MLTSLDDLAMSENAGGAIVTRCELHSGLTRSFIASRLKCEKLRRDS